MATPASTCSSPSVATSTTEPPESSVGASPLIPSSSLTRNTFDMDGAADGGFQRRRRGRNPFESTVCC